MAFEKFSPPAFPPDSAEARYLSQAIQKEVQTLATSAPAAAEMCVESEAAYIARMKRQEQAAADYVKNLSLQTPPLSPKKTERP